MAVTAPYKFTLHGRNSTLEVHCSLFTVMTSSDTQTSVVDYPPSSGKTPQGQRKWLWLLIILGFLAGGGLIWYFFLRNNSDSTPPAPPPVNVTLQRVETGQLAPMPKQH